MINLRHFNLLQKFHIKYNVKNEKIQNQHYHHTKITKNVKEFEHNDIFIIPNLIDRILNKSVILWTKIVQETVS